MGPVLPLSLARFSALTAALAAVGMASAGCGGEKPAPRSGADTASVVEVPPPAPEAEVVAEPSDEPVAADASDEGGADESDDLKGLSAEERAERLARILAALEKRNAGPPQLLSAGSRATGSSSAPKTAGVVRVKGPPEPGGVQGRLALGRHRPMHHAVRRHVHAMKKCFQAELAKDPAFETLIKPRLVIAADGRLTSVSLRSKSKRKSFDHCITAVLKSVVYPRPQDGKEVVFDFQLRFKSNP